MIITNSKHGRVPKDGRRLVAHLLKDENESIEVAEIGNSVAASLDGAIRDMEILRDASHSAAAFHHFSVSPPSIIPAKVFWRRRIACAWNSIQAAPGLM